MLNTTIGFFFAFCRLNNSIVLIMIALFLTGCPFSEPTGDGDSDADSDGDIDSGRDSDIEPDTDEIEDSDVESEEDGDIEADVELDPTRCNTGTVCENDDDCGGGNRCNLEVTPPQCQELYCGTLGVPCNDNNLCAPGFFCNLLGETDICTDGRAGVYCGRTDVDGEWIEFPCREDLWCDFDGRCKERADLGEHCSIILDRDADVVLPSCRSGLWCHSPYPIGESTCLEIGTDGDICASRYNVEMGCAEGFYCSYVGFEDGTCHVRGELGASCNRLGQCAEDFYCSVGDEQCVARSGLGGPCSKSAHYRCQPELYCTYPEVTCQPRSSVGEECSSDVLCLAEAFCDYEIKGASRCAPRGADGEACEWHGECLEGYLCLGLENAKTCQPI